MKPILFNTEMVRAILEGRKLVTRRVVKPQPPNAHDILDFDEENNSFDFLCGMIADNCFIDFAYTAKAPYRPGDILYVRETWCKTDCFGLQDGYVYKANDNSILEQTGFIPKWRPSIHMPREAARIFLRVESVRVERLQNVTDEQAKKEGAEEWLVASTRDWDKNPDYILSFRYIWNHTVKKEYRALYGWDANPWVWVIEFERISREEAEQCQ